ncbi:hypothetical protein E1263_42265 [Kribbella antibiotica]|uniref:Uncharacterized protein n=1 Tax=Kribbella antibiotica TaxID=190195 RepID=A0A4V2YKD0_9ACTN|nr:hypothetical protein E1263_42265 [Kribbella antibiotica]
MNDPTKPSRKPLEAAGLAGTWVTAAIDDARSLRTNGWYRAGGVEVRSVKPEMVDLDAPQPEVTLATCVDSSATTLHFQKDRKVVPVGPGTSRRNSFTAKVVYAPRVGTTAKAWLVVEEKAIGKC